MGKLRSRIGFTLVEVTLALGVLATSILTICVLYSFGYRENRQSEEDVLATAYADAYLAPLVAVLSSPHLKWRDWQKIGATGANVNDPSASVRIPANGWRDYIDVITRGKETTYRVKSNPKSLADRAFDEVKGKLASAQISVSKPSIPSEYCYGLVVTRSGPVIQLAFRMGRREQQLISQPIFVTEVYFQGGWDQNAD